MTPAELGDELNGAVSQRIAKVLDMAQELGWFENTHTSLVVRLSREDAVPFFARWDLVESKDGTKRSWRFQGARAANGQALNYNDILIYLNDPTVIHPEPPEDDLGRDYRAWLEGEEQNSGREEGKPAAR